MDKLIFAVLLSCIIFSISSCSDSVNSPGTTTPVNETLFAWQYSDNFYFANKVYRESFERYYTDSTNTLTTSQIENTIILDSLEIWIQATGYMTLNRRQCAVYTDLYEQPTGGYSDSLKKPRMHAGKSFLGWFRPLFPNEYYIDTISGVIGLKVSIPNSYHIAITYTTRAGKKFGIRQSETANYRDTLILKLIKSNADPELSPDLWQLKIKNIYQFNAPIPLDENKFDFRICYELDNGVCNEYISNYLTFIRAFRLDRFSNEINKFKVIENISVIRDMNAVVIPFLEPFNSRIANFTSDQRYLYPQLYHSNRNVAANSPSASRYKLTAVYR